MNVNRIRWEALSALRLSVISMTCIAAWLMLGLSAQATAEMLLVVPPGLEDVEGSTGFVGGPAPPDLNGLRSHEVHPASYFSGLTEGHNTIVSIRLRPDREVTSPLTFIDDDFELLLSTTSAAPNTLSTTFAENIGADETLVYSGAIQFVTDGVGPPDGPLPFDYLINFQTPFVYDPDQGNLLLEFRFSPDSISQGQDGPFFDGHVSNGIRTVASDLYESMGILASTGSKFDGLPVKEFTFVTDAEILSLLQAGDADQDRDFDQLDLVQVQQAAKYLTGQPATWGEGDWDGAPGGARGNPPDGNGLFDQLDVIAALTAGTYLTGPYAAVQPNGQLNDQQAAITYDTSTGELAVDVPAETELTSINIDSAAGVFTGEPAVNLGGSFDNDSDGNIFIATFGSSFGSVTFGNVTQAGLSEEFVRGDLDVVGSLAGGGDLGNVDLVYVPEPASALLLLIGFVFATKSMRRID